MGKKFDMSHPMYDHLGKFQASEMIDQGHECIGKIDLGLDPEEMKDYKADGMDHDSDDCDKIASSLLDYDA